MVSFSVVIKGKGSIVICCAKEALGQRKTDNVRKAQKIDDFIIKVIYLNDELFKKMLKKSFLVALQMLCI